MLMSVDGRHSLVDMLRTLQLWRTVSSTCRTHCDWNCRLITSFTDIPTVDISALVTNGSPEAQRKAGEELHTACVEVGFFYIKNHAALVQRVCNRLQAPRHYSGVPEEVVTGARSVARTFFEQPEEIKRTIGLSASTHYRGYQSLGANVTRYEDGFQRDWHEAIDVYYETADSTSKSGGALSPSRIHGLNQWPDAHVPQLRATMNQYVGCMNHVGAAVMRGIALGLNLADPAFFDARNKGQDPYWCMRIIHYPPLADADRSKGRLPEQASVQPSSGSAAGAAHGQVNAESALAGAELPRSTQLSCGEHTDYGLLTMVNQDDHVSALQVKNSAGSWITAAPIPDTFVCNIGDMMRIWTNGLYEPTLHRVANADRSRSRVSLPFFYEPAFDTVVTPIPGLHGSSETHMLSPKHYGRHLESKVFSNFEL